ncbi:MAG: hypothetical protein FWD68_12290 [Alphaproteobacteria bacterium]|nr:hypothetical protein [Alphaproteobacteria bacterium]
MKPGKGGQRETGLRGLLSVQAPVTFPPGSGRQEATHCAQPDTEGEPFLTGSMIEVEIRDHFEAGRYLVNGIHPLSDVSVRMMVAANTKIVCLEKLQIATTPSSHSGIGATESRIKYLIHIVAVLSKFIYSLTGSYRKALILDREENGGHLVFQIPNDDTVNNVHRHAICSHTSCLNFMAARNWNRYFGVFTRTPSRCRLLCTT